MTPSTPQPRRRTVARHGQLRSPRPVSQLFKILAVAVASVLVAVVGVVGFTVYSFTTDYVSNAVALPGEDSVPPDIGAIQGGYNLLIVGTDECLPDFAAMFPGRCSGADDGSINNDVDIVVHISDNPRRVTVISFPRDLMLPIPSCTRDDGTKTSAMSKQPLNSTYSVAGLGCVAQTITSLTGMQIQGAAKITWGGVIQITDAIGGVDVCVSGRIYDPTNT
ncbi:LCP family protein, partial [Microbacterium sp. Leaf351]